MTGVRRSVVVLLVLSVVATGMTVLLDVHVANACSCVSHTDTQAVDAADAVFSGTVIRVDDAERRRGEDGLGYTFTVGVDGSFKGSPVLVQAVRSPESSPACGVIVAAGDRVLVFARDTRGIVRPRAREMQTTACSGTRVLDGPVPDTVRAAASGGIVECRNQIDAVTDVPDGFDAVAGVVALPTKRLSYDESTGPPYFAKQGLLVMAGRGAELVVPRPWRDRVAISWGGAAPSSRLVLPPCPWVGFPSWYAFAGGFTVDGPACVPITVVAERTETVRVSVGRDCP